MGASYCGDCGPRCYGHRSWNVQCEHCGGPTAPELDMHQGEDSPNETFGWCESCQIGTFPEVIER